jgi:hypothetical protein
MSSHITLGSSTRSFGRRLLRRATTVLLVSVIGCQSPNFCTIDLQTTEPRLRLTVKSAAGETLDGVARVARIDPGGGMSDFVAIGAVGNLDPSGLWGRGELRLLVTAPGFVSKEVLLPQDCENAELERVLVVLRQSE